MAVASLSSLLSLFVFVLIFSASALADADLLNIDCGASDGFTSQAANLTWVGDGDYVRTGETHKLPNATSVFATLRSFPTGKKNCYTIPMEANRKVRVTLYFVYGNYDGLSKPPKFAVLLDSHKLVVFESKIYDSPHYYQYIKIVYVTRGVNASICLGREIDDHVPFINAMQVSVLDPHMYPLVNSSFVLAEKRRVAFGAVSTIRYRDDPYDRVWVPADAQVEGFHYTLLASNATKVNTSSSINDPPPKLFQTAAAPPGGEKNLTILVAHDANAYTYINMYFSEVSDLAASRLLRSFHIHMDDTPLTSNPVVPPFQYVLEMSGFLFAPANTKLTLVPTDNSTLPPIINGLEVLNVVGVIASNGTYHADVNALTILQDKFAALQNWTGDPCLPEYYNWEWLKCSSDEPPRITMISLGAYGLSGSLPNFRGLDALETIDLHNNSLNGEIPEFLANLPELKYLNLAYNNFSSIPTSLVNNPKIKFNITGNPLLEHNVALPPSSSRASTLDTHGCDRIPNSVLIAAMLMLMIAIVPRDQDA